MKSGFSVEKILRLVVLIILLLRLTATAVFAGNEDIPVKKRFPAKTLNVENNLQNNQTNSIVTDKLGFTWVSTYLGLQRFNGYQLVTINPIVNNDTFHINYPVYLFKLNDGCIWITVQQGILEYNPDKDHFRLLISYPISGGSHFSIVPMKESDGSIWCLQQHEGIVVYDPDGKQVSRFSIFNARATDSILQSDEILTSDLFATDENFIYVSGLNNGIFTINTKERTKAFISTSGSRVTGMACCHQKLYAVTSSTLLCIDHNQQEQLRNENLDQLPDQNITRSCLWYAGDGDFLFSRDQYLYTIDTNGVIKYELTDFNRKPFLSTGFIRHIYSDNLNRIWLLTNNDIKRIQNAEAPFDHYLYPDAKNNFVRALYFDEQSNVLLAGCFNGEIQAYDTMANPLWSTPPGIPAGGYILSIIKLSSTDYLLIDFSKGWFVFDISTRQITPFRIAPSHQLSLPENENFINNVQRLNDSTVLIATENNIFQCTFKRDQLYSAKALLPQSLGGQLNCFFADMNGVLWIGGANGIIYKFSDDKADSIHVPGSYSIRCMAKDDRMNLWIGTEKGLFVFNNRGNLLRRITEETGLRNDFIYSLLCVPGGVIAGTNLGLAEVSLTGAIRNFSKEMGLQENEFNTGAAVKTKRGKLFFGGVNGITAFYPSSISQVRDSLLVHIIQLTVNDSSFNSSAGIWQGDTIRLNYKQNHLKFELAAMGLFNADEYVYQYRMLGLDTVWQNTTYQPTAINYTLQPGSYNLEIRCRSTLSSGRMSYKNYELFIQPPWWDLWWFRLMIFIAGAGTIYFILYRYNRKKYADKIKKLEMQQQIQTERERISRELHDNIGSQVSLIISNIDWTIDRSDELSREEEKKQLGHINETARNVMGNLRESIWALNKEKISLEEFADRLKSYVQHIIQTKPSLEFSFKEEIKQNISLSPTETLNLFRICQECINNVFQHAEATSLNVSIHSANNHSYYITIEDNGKGFDPSKKINNHYGLENMKHRAGELNARLSMYSEMDKGSKITISK